MILDDLLVVMILVGIGLSGAYLRAAILSNRRIKAAESNREALQRELHNKRVRSKQMDMPRQPRTDPSSSKNQYFPDDEGIGARLTHV